MGSGVFARGDPDRTGGLVAHSAELRSEVIQPTGIPSQNGFDSDRDCRDRIGMASPTATAPTTLLFCKLMSRVILLVFVLVSAAIDDKSDFKFILLWY